MLSKYKKPGNMAIRPFHFSISLVVSVLAGVLELASGATSLTPLTTGPGNDSEAAWSPDGRRIAFQTDRNGSLDLCVLDVETKEVTARVHGPGHAAFPAWSPDGKWIAYSFCCFTKTALEGQKDGYNLFLIAAGGGSPRQLTHGHHRDASPAFQPDGKTIWFSSDRGNPDKSNALSLFAVSTKGGEPELVLRREGVDRGAVQVSFSPDGTLFAYGALAGFLDNWRIRLAKTEFPQDGFTLTSAQASFYGPRWSPSGTLFACTGFQVGDAGWGVWLVDPRTGHRARLETGPGNSRSPAWSPDGRQLVFENNGTGTYKLYSMAAPSLPPSPVDGPSPGTDRLVLHYSFAKQPGPAVLDASPLLNNGEVIGSLSWRDGAVGFAPQGASISIPNAKGFDFGSGPFSVRAVVRLPEDSKFGMIVMGEYPGNRLGWQLYVTDDRRAWFNSRTPALVYRGARSNEPLPADRPVTLTGVRDAAGCVRLYVDGDLQQMISQDAFYAYGPPVQIRIGTQYDGKSAPLLGRIFDLAVYARELSASEIAGDSLTQFWRSHAGKQEGAER